MKKRRIPWYFRNPKDGAEMVLIPGGWFWMGNDKYWWMRFAYPPYRFSSTDIIFAVFGMHDFGMKRIDHG